MNSDRRHELQQNDLAIYLNKINKAVEPHSRIIAIAVGVVIVGAISWGLYSSSQTANRSDATLQLIQATATGIPEDLLTVSEEFPDTAAGAWARVYQGNQYLAEGIQSLYTDRAEATKSLEDATNTFNRALEISKDRLLVSRAHFGIARAAESLGDIEAATAAYEQVIAVNESEGMVELAEERIETLKSPATQDFLAWFAEQDFAPKADPTMPPGLPNMGDVPSDPTSIPGLNLDFESGIAPRNLDGGLDLPEGDAMEPESNEETTGDAGIGLPTIDEPTETPPANTESTESTSTETESTEPPAAETTETSEATSSETAEEATGEGESGEGESGEATESGEASGESESEGEGAGEGENTGSGDS